LQTNQNGLVIDGDKTKDIRTWGRQQVTFTVSHFSALGASRLPGKTIKGGGFIGSLQTSPRQCRSSASDRYHRSF
jgi:hypothetical protein